MSGIKKEEMKKRMKEERKEGSKDRMFRTVIQSEKEEKTYL
mgnify:CR=1 FL=1